MIMVTQQAQLLLSSTTASNNCGHMPYPARHWTAPVVTQRHKDEKTHVPVIAQAPCVPEYSDASITASRLQ